MEEGEEVEQECMSMPSSSSSSSSSINDVILAPINHILMSPVERGVDNIEGGWMGGQPPSKPCYVPKPPKRKRKITRRKKNSNYDWETAREELGVTHNSHVYAAANAATASTANNTTSATINSPSKEEDKAENKKLKEQTYKLEEQTYALECKVGMAKRKANCLQTRVKSLLDALKAERIKSRVAIEKLLLVTATEHDTLLKTFHDKTADIENDHYSPLLRITRDSSNMANDNEKAINREISDYNKWIMELAQEMKDASVKEQEATRKLNKSKALAYKRLQKLQKESQTRRDTEDELVNAAKALSHTEEELQIANSLYESSNDTKLHMKKEWNAGLHNVRGGS